jgi:hypothetical protein
MLAPGWYRNLQLLQPWFLTNLHSSPLPLERKLIIVNVIHEFYKKLINENIYISLVIIFIFSNFWQNVPSRWELDHNLLFQAFRWESLWRWDLGNNFLLSRAFRWESLWRWDLVHNLLSQPFRWESLWRWDLGFHGALGYHEAFSRIFLSHDGISAITEP